jgi:hypothetical protein
MLLLYNYLTVTRLDSTKPFLPDARFALAAWFTSNVTFKDIEILLNVNDENAQYNINDVDQNGMHYRRCTLGLKTHTRSHPRTHTNNTAYLVLGAPYATCKVGMPVLEFGDPITVVSVELMVCSQTPHTASPGGREQSLIDRWTSARARMVACFCDIHCGIQYASTRNWSTRKHGPSHEDIL